MSAFPPIRRSPVESGSNGGSEGKSKIVMTSGSGAGPTVESQWKRPTEKGCQSATHVRTFTGKMNSSGLEHLDRHINEWLDNHPDAEVKFSTMQVGEMASSMGKESVVVVQVWI